MESKQKPVVILLTNDDLVMGLFKKLGSRMFGDGCDVVRATARPECQKDIPDVMTAVANLNSTGRQVAGILFHDKTLPVEYKDNPGFKELWQSAVMNLAETRKKMDDNWQAELDKLQIALPDTMDPTQQSVFYTQFEMLKQAAKNNLLNEAMDEIKKVNEAANGLLERLVPSDASITLLRNLREQPGLKESPIVIIGSFPGRDKEYFAAAGSEHTFVFDSSSSANFIKDGVDKLKEFLPPSVRQGRAHG